MKTRRPKWGAPTAAARAWNIAWPPPRNFSSSALIGNESIARQLTVMPFILQTKLFSGRTGQGGSSFGLAEIRFFVPLHNVLEGLARAMRRCDSLLERSRDHREPGPPGAEPTSIRDRGG